MWTKTLDNKNVKIDLVSISYITENHNKSVKIKNPFSQKFKYVHCTYTVHRANWKQNQYT